MLTQKKFCFVKHLFLLIWLPSIIGCRIVSQEYAANEAELYTGAEDIDPTQIPQTPIINENPTLVQSTVTTGVETVTNDYSLVASLQQFDVDTQELVGSSGVYLLRVNGEIGPQITQVGINPFKPTWSPDCNQIAFGNNLGYYDERFHENLSVMDLTSHQLTELTSPFEINGYPSWSPLGNQIAFEGYDGDNIQIYVFSLQSKEIIQLTTEGNNQYPAWSPDGQKIAFVSDRNEGSSASIYTMNEDGSAQKQLLPFSASVDSSTFDNPAIYDPKLLDWSPDGQMIAYHVTENVAGYEVGKIYVVSSTGLDNFPLITEDRANTDLANNAFYSIWESDPNWSPDGQQILFSRSNSINVDETEICLTDIANNETTCHRINDDNIILSIDWCSSG